jgi:hypothetical protein
MELPEISDVSYLLDVLETTVRTLSLVGGEPDEQLHDTVVQLKIARPSLKGRFKRDPTEQYLPKALASFNLCHVKALVSWLRLVRAKRMVANNQTPFHKANRYSFSNKNKFE